MFFSSSSLGVTQAVSSSSIIRDIDRLCANGLALMAYYYFDFGDTDKQHRRGLLSSLLCQLCAESDPCYEILFDLYSSHGEGTREPSEGALTRCLMDMLQLEGLPAIYFIVDALDGCPNSYGMPTPREKVDGIFVRPHQFSISKCTYLCHKPSGVRHSKCSQTLGSVPSVASR